MHDGYIKIELENLNCEAGSGLFPFSAMMEHSCIPNCSFTTKEDVLYMKALREIKAGERLSIDYINCLTLPIEKRKEVLQDSYNFDCKCDRCESKWDISRSFKCPANNCNGQIYSAVNNSIRSRENTVFKLNFNHCSKCLRKLSDDEQKNYINEEQYLLNLITRNESNDMDVYKLSSQHVHENKNRIT